MSFDCNMGKVHRAAYLLIGVALVAIPWIVGITGWLRIGLPALGGLTFFAGLVGR